VQSRDSSNAETAASEQLHSASCRQRHAGMSLALEETMVDEFVKMPMK